MKKSIILFSVFVSVGVVANTYKLSCVNEARSPLVTDLTFSSEQLKINFKNIKSDKSDSPGPEELDLNNKSVSLFVNEDRARNQDYAEYKGQALVNQLLGEYRTIEVSIKKSEIEKTNDIALQLFISNRTRKNSDGNYTLSYGMICQKK